MASRPFRVRFAPAPTGMMHLGNIRTALMNHLIAQKHEGVMVLRIEDTDPERNYDPQAEKIIEDLSWLGIGYQEGPQKGGPNAPYFQSQRTQIYQEQLQKLIDKQLVYRCFCTQEELEKKRNRQIALKQPPRYDRACLKLSATESKTKAESTPFIWRFALDHTKKLTINDLSHGPVTFELKNFSDFPITRQDGSVTFMFANFVDDVLMNISCVIRGEDHLSNTAGQAAMYDALGQDLPTFWHMPILCNIDGKKLSKRDFGFSLRDLKKAGFLPEAIINYLAIIGASFKDEIMNQQQLIQAIDFDKPGATGQIKYDVEKLRWVNHKWIGNYNIEKLTTLCRPYLEPVYPPVTKLSDTQLGQLISFVQQEMVTLEDSIRLLAFYFGKPVYEIDITRTLMPTEQLPAVIKLVQEQSNFNSSQQFMDNLKVAIKQSGIAPKSVYSFVRYALMASPHGPGIIELIDILGIQEAQERLTALINLVQ